MVRLSWGSTCLNPVCITWKALTALCVWSWALKLMTSHTNSYRITWRHAYQGPAIHHVLSTDTRDRYNTQTSLTLSPFHPPPTHRQLTAAVASWSPKPVHTSCDQSLNDGCCGSLSVTRMFRAWPVDLEPLINAATTHTHRRAPVLGGPLTRKSHYVLHSIYLSVSPRVSANPI